MTIRRLGLERKVVRPVWASVAGVASPWLGWAALGIIGVGGAAGDAGSAAAARPGSGGALPYGFAQASPQGTSSLLPTRRAEVDVGERGMF